MLTISPIEESAVFLFDSPLEESLLSAWMVANAKSCNPDVVFRINTCNGLNSFLRDTFRFSLIFLFSIQSKCWSSYSVEILFEKIVKKKSRHHTLLNDCSHSSIQQLNPKLNGLSVWRKFNFLISFSFIVQSKIIALILECKSQCDVTKAATIQQFVFT